MSGYFPLFGGHFKFGRGCTFARLNFELVATARFSFRSLLGPEIFLEPWWAKMGFFINFYMCWFLTLFVTNMCKSVLQHVAYTGTFRGLTSKIKDFRGLRKILWIFSKTVQNPPIRRILDPEKFLKFQKFFWEIFDLVAGEIWAFAGNLRFSHFRYRKKRI